MATTLIPFNSFTISCSRTRTAKSHNKDLLLFKPNSFTPPNTTTTLFSCKLVTHKRENLSPTVKKFRPCQAFISNSDYNEAETTSQSQPNNPITETTIDIKLPRRNLLVQFTCTACGERTERLINRLAYERGTVFVQCAGCLKHHKLVDNLGLVVEYNLLEDTDD